RDDPAPSLEGVQMLPRLRRLFQKSLAAPGKGPRCQVLLGVERLQDRIVPSSSPVSLHSHTLVIQGTGGADHVTVSQAHGKLTVVDDHRKFSFPAAQVKMIVFNGRAGDDTFLNNTAIGAVADGGAGNDRLTGGSGNDVLRGSSGD